MRITFPGVTRVNLVIFAVFLIIFQLVRLLFILIYIRHAEGATALEIFWMFVLGLRFDVSTASILLAPFVLLSHIPRLWDIRGFRLGYMISIVIILTGALFISLGDCFYYNHSAKRISFEVLTVLDPELWWPLLSLALVDHPVLLPVVVVAFCLGTISICTLLGRLQCWRSVGGKPQDTVIWGFIVLVFMIIGIRGGLQNIQLRISNAYFSSRIILNHATLNPVYTFLWSLNDDRSTFVFMPEDEATTVVRQLVAGENEHYISDSFPLVRRVDRLGGRKRYNVLLFLIECFSAEVFGALGCEHNATPNLDRIASEGILFDRFFSAGSRTPHGMFATLFSVPANFGSPVLRTSLILNEYRSIATFLKDYDYRTMYIMSGLYTFANAEGVLRNSGFDLITGEPLPGKKGIKKRPWGYDDEHMFERLLAEISEPNENPFFAVLFPQQTHNRGLPDHFPRLFPKTIPHSAFFNQLNYVDWCFGDFFKKAREFPFFDDTIFVFVADHSAHNNPHRYENYRIMMMIYAPKIIEPRRLSVIGSQVDILPIILGLLNISTEHASFGRDLLSPNMGDGFAFLTLSDSIGWIEGPMVLYDFLDETPPQMYNYIEDYALENNLAVVQPELAHHLQRQARAYLQVSRTLLLSNRIYPSR